MLRMHMRFAQKKWEKIRVQSQSLLRLDKKLKALRLYLCNTNNGPTMG